MDSGERIKLYLLGISYSPVHQGAFAMILAEENGPYRIPIVIGSSEAQSIAIKMENIITPRPITHDLFCSFAQAFGVELKDVFIYKFEEGIFYSEMRFSDGLREVVMDARTSDAVAIAIRTGAPIFTTSEILHSTGAILEETTEADDSNSSHQDGESKASASLEDKSVEELEELLNKHIEDENYEEAAKVSEILKKKQ